MSKLAVDTKPDYEDRLVLLVELTSPADLTPLSHQLRIHPELRLILHTSKDQNKNPSPMKEMGLLMTEN